MAWGGRILCVYWFMLSLQHHHSWPSFARRGQKPPPGAICFRFELGRTVGHLMNIWSSVAAITHFTSRLCRRNVCNVYLCACPCSSVSWNNRLVLRGKSWPWSVRVCVHVPLLLPPPQRVNTVGWHAITTTNDQRKNDSQANHSNTFLFCSLLWTDTCTGQDLADLGERLRDWFQLLQSNAKQNNSTKSGTRTTAASTTSGQSYSDEKENVESSAFHNMELFKGDCFRIKIRNYRKSSINDSWPTPFRGYVATSHTFF